MSDAMLSTTLPSILSPQERLRVRSAVFEDFSRSTVQLQEEPPSNESSQPPALEHPLPEPLAEPAAEPAAPPADWETTWEQELQRAYEQGFEDGKTAAAALYEAEFRRHHQLLQPLDHFIQSLRDHFLQLRQSMEQVAVRLAFLLAEHILDTHLRQDPAAIEQLLRRALQSIPGGEGQLRIHLHPETLEALRRAGSVLVSGQDPTLLLISDPSVEPTGCLIESPWGIVDAQLRQMLQNIREQLQC